jgi:hypothetical protein
MTEAIVVTGCDEHHDHLAEELLSSLRAGRTGGYTIGFIRLGAAQLPASLRALADRVAHVDLGEAEPRAGEGFKLAYAGSKAALPSLFPGFETYIWLDGDTWVQNDIGIAQIAEGAATADISIHPQLDPNYYRCQFPDTYTLHVYDRLFGAQERARLARFPMVNAGVFGASGSSRLWAEWSASLAEVRARVAKRGGERFFSDQIPLHRLIYTGRLTLSPLRAANNWLALHAVPRLDRATGKLTSPSPPYEEINIVHLVGASKSAEYDIDGRMRSLRYSALRPPLSRTEAG